MDSGNPHHVSLGEASGKVVELRRQAEVMALRLPALSSPGFEAALPAQAAGMFHELCVHQIELEMQNEELSRIQVELDSSRALYFDLYDAAPVGYFILDSQGTILEVNSTGARLLGLARDMLLGKFVTQFILSLDQDPFYFLRKRLIDTGVAQAMELRMVKTGGPDFWARLEAAVVTNGEAEPNIRMVLSDITERRRLESHVRQSQKMDSLGIMARGVAHDMNNVLSAILGLASVHAEIQPAGGQVQMAFESITKACDRGGQLIRSLMGFSRLGLTEVKELDLNDLAQNEVWLIMRTTLGQVHFEMDLAADLRPILGEENELTHALINLCVNAVDAMPEGGTLGLRSRNLGTGWVEIQVEDTGTGMSEEVLEKALDPFFTTKEQGKGSGMGLSIVHRAVLAHHGEMELFSQPGRGTRVSLRFPACERRGLAPPPPLAMQRELASLQLQILVVDDDELIQSSMQMVLEILGHKVVSAMSGEEALVQLEGGYEPDVVFLDMNMPGLGGKGTLPRIRALRPALPVVIATGRPDQTVLDLISTHPHVTQLPKPFGTSQLRDHLESLRKTWLPRSAGLLESGL
jgi:PAS domain S-box-containing protein